MNLHFRDASNLFCTIYLFELKTFILLGIRGKQWVHLVINPGFDTATALGPRVRRRAAWSSPRLWELSVAPCGASSPLRQLKVCCLFASLPMPLSAQRLSCKQSLSFQMPYRGLRSTMLRPLRSSRTSYPGEDTLQSH